MRNPHIRPGFWRGVNTNHNALYSECFIDELAHAAGQDPLEFRRKMLKPKHLAVLNAAAERAGYGKAPAGTYHGLAQFMGYGSYVAACAEVSVSTDGRLKIHRIVAATNPGHAVNPAQIERQVAGSFVYGLSAALYGEITVNGGAIEQTNFDSYNVMRIDEMPKVEVVIVPTGDFWGGVGEPTICGRGPGGAQRDLRSDRQAHPLAAAEKPGSEERVIKSPSLALPRLAPSPALRERGDPARRPVWVRVLSCVALIITTGTAAAEVPPGGSSCSGCHPASAKEETPVPSIRGREPAEIVTAMQAFRSGERPSTVMGRIAKGFSDDEIRAIAAWLRGAAAEGRAVIRTTRRAFCEGRGGRCRGGSCGTFSGAGKTTHRRYRRRFWRRDLRPGAAPRRSSF